MINEYLILLFAIITHEIGHYTAFLMAGFEPDIKITWWGISMGEKTIPKLKPTKLLIISIAGIITGLITLAIFQVKETIYLTYLIMCSVDITTIITILSFKKDWYKLNMKEIYKKQIKEMEE